jgi:hypothetical protein
MGCCNQPPKGGTKEVGPLLKMLAIFMVVIFAIALIFG